MSIVLPEITQAFIATSARRPPQALLLTGPVGSGSFTLAQLIGSEWGSVYEIIRPEAKTSGGVASIAVEVVRSLYERTRSKVATPQIVIIDDADTMNATAQNALLKLLEEPVPHVHFILTSHHPDRLLPTVRSRLQTFVIPPLDDAASIRLARQHGIENETKQRQIIFAANGLPAEISRLTNDDAYFASLLERMTRVRQFIEGDRLEKIAMIAKLKDNRAETLQFIETVIAVLRRSLTKSADDATLHLIDAMCQASDAVAANGNIRLQMTAAVL